MVGDQAWFFDAKRLAADNELNSFVTPSRRAFTAVVSSIVKVIILYLRFLF
jgi:hypothetical protein